MLTQEPEVNSWSIGRGADGEVIAWPINTKTAPTTQAIIIPRHGNRAGAYEMTGSELRKSLLTKEEFETKVEAS